MGHKFIIKNVTSILVIFFSAAAIARPLPDMYLRPLAALDRGKPVSQSEIDAFLNSLSEQERQAWDFLTGDEVGVDPVALMSRAELSTRRILRAGTDTLRARWRFFTETEGTPITLAENDQVSGASQLPALGIDRDVMHNILFLFGHSPRRIYANWNYLTTRWPASSGYFTQRLRQNPSYLGGSLLNRFVLHECYLQTLTNRIGTLPDSLDLQQNPDLIIMQEGGFENILSSILGDTAVEDYQTFRRHWPVLVEIQQRAHGNLDQNWPEVLLVDPLLRPHIRLMLGDNQFRQGLFAEDGRLRDVAYRQPLDIPEGGARMSLWPEQTGSSQGLEDFREYLSIEDFEALADANTFFQRAVVLCNALGIPHSSFSELVGKTQHLLWRWSRQESNFPQSNRLIKNACDVLRADPLFLLEGTHDIEEAMQRYRPSGRVRLAMRMEGISFPTMARRMGISYGTFESLLRGDAPPTRRELFEIARALNQGLDEPRWPPVLLEFGVQPPACGMLANPPGDTGFLHGPGRKRQELMECAGELADAIVAVWQGEGRYQPDVIGRWSRQIRPFDCPHKRQVYYSVTGALLGFKAGTLDQARHYDLITQEIMQWLLAWRQTPRDTWLRSRQVVELARRLAQAHDEIDGLFSLQERYLPASATHLRPPEGYDDRRTAEIMDDGAWYWLSRMISRPRALVLLNNLPGNFDIFKSLLLASNPEARIENKQRGINQLIAAEGNIPEGQYRFTPGIISFIVWNYRDPRATLREMRPLCSRLLNRAQHRWIQPVRPQRILTTPETFVRAFCYNGLQQVRNTVHSIDNRNAALQLALLRSTQPELTEGHDILNRVFAWIQYLEPGHPFVRRLQRCPVRTDHEAQMAFLNREDGPNDFLESVMQHLPSDTTHVEDMDAFTRRIAEFILAGGTPPAAGTGGLKKQAEVTQVLEGMI